MKAYIVAGVALLLTACITTPEQKAQKRAELDHGKCVSYGIQAGTQQYAECRLTLERLRSQERAARASSSGATAAYGLMLLQKSRPQPVVPAIRPPLNCRTIYNPYGSSTQCF